MTPPRLPRVRRMTGRRSGPDPRLGRRRGLEPRHPRRTAFFAADPDGFFLGELGGRRRSRCVSCVRYGDDFGFLGQYIVRPRYRGTGYGLAIWRAGMAHLAGRNIGLDGVLAQVRSYERIGFRFAHHTCPLRGHRRRRPAGRTVSLADVPFAEVAAYDATCFPARREAFLRTWVSLPGVGRPGGRRRSARLTGYGVLRRSADGYKVGPLFADDAETAAATCSPGSSRRSPAGRTASTSRTRPPSRPARLAGSRSSG